MSAADKQQLESEAAEFPAAIVTMGGEVMMASAMDSMVMQVWTVWEASDSSS